MIQVRNLHKSFGAVTALAGVGFDVPEGRVTGLLGANGAGKSTTIRIITGYTVPDAGWVRVGDLWAHQSPIALRRILGYLPESAPTYGEMPVAALLRYRAALYGLVGKARKAAVERAIDTCDLAPVRRRRVAHLSKGYRQRVGLATAILHDPPVLVLDEPTNGLDPGQISHTRSLIRRLAQGRTVLVSSHILPEIERTCDRVVILARGRLCAQGQLDELLDRGRRELIVEATFTSPAAHAGALAAVRAVQGILGVLPRELDGSLVRWRVEFDPERIGESALRQAVGDALAAADARVRLLERRRATLEDLFLELMEQGPPRPHHTTQEPAA
ncbi:MAG: multidrug ABC transporter ATP-binding protein [Phycisphaerales bacterium]|nr:MAG: multidrug ABC transporter ATP-binding protein [Phycisphaerales bacterium]